MYVPFWMFDLNSKVQVNAVCTRVHHYDDGEYRVTETEYYNAYRDINLDYLKIPVDASEKMNDELMDKLEPYAYSELKEFNTAYLAGYMRKSTIIPMTISFRGRRIKSAIILILISDPPSPGIRRLTLRMSRFRPIKSAAFTYCFRSGWSATTMSGLSTFLR